MWIPKFLHIKNLMSHEDSLFKIVNRQATMVYGINKSDDGQKSNGSGKSVIGEGLAIAYLGSPLRSVSVTDLIRTGQPSFEVVHTLYNELLKEEMVITRHVFANSNPSKLLITINGKIPKKLKVNASDKIDVRHGNKFILEKLGIGSEDLLNYYLISKEKFTPFFSMGDKAMKLVVDRFSKSNIVDPVFDVISEKSVEYENQIDELREKIVHNEGKIDGLNEEIAHNTKVELQKANDLKIQTLSSKQQSKEALLRESMIKLKTVEKELESLQEDIPEEIDNSKELSKIDKLISSQLTVVKEISDEIDEATKLRSQYIITLTGVIECPRCDHRFKVGDDEADIAKAERNKTKVDSILEELKQELDEETAKGSKLRKKQETLTIESTKASKAIREIEMKVSKLSAKVNTQTSTISAINDEIDVIVKRIKDLNDIEIEDNTARFKKRIEEINEENDSFKQEIERIDKLRFDNEQWTINFVRFKTHLCNKSIAVIQAHCNEYLRRMNTNISIQISGYKINKDKSIREKISINVARDGIQEGLFDKFSTGEKVKMILASILSLQKLINLNTESGGLDLCFLDEICDGLDSEGIESAMNTLNDLNQTILVITHGTFEKRYPHNIFIVKDKGISKIK